ncbi:resolvase [Synergistales bacterium]|nr:resolvase [Synergistales bacterium]
MILGIDPGLSKVGWAAVREDGGLVLSGVFKALEAKSFFEVWTKPFDKWEENLSCWTLEKIENLTDASALSIALGNGTGSAEIAALCRRVGLRFELTDERMTTLEARLLYWKVHKPLWWQRFLPVSVRIPPRSLDDFAAWVIARRFILACSI